MLVACNLGAVAVCRRPPCRRPGLEPTRQRKADRGNISEKCLHASLQLTCPGCGQLWTSTTRRMHRIPESSTCRAAALPVCGRRKLLLESVETVSRQESDTQSAQLVGAWISSRHGSEGVSLREMRRITPRKIHSTVTNEPWLRDRRHV